MKIWKLVSGILSIILSVVVGLQSCSVIMAETLSKSDQNAGGSGFWVGVMMLAFGIVNVATSGAKGKGGSVAVMIVSLFGVIFSFSTFKQGGYPDIVIWGGWCGIVCILALVDLCLPKRKSGIINS